MTDSKTTVDLQGLRVAIVHEWIVDYSGSERVLEQILRVFPGADLFAVIEFLPESLKGFIQNKPVRTSYIQHLPFAKSKYRSYLPLMPLAVEQFDLSDYDLVISSSHAVAKGVITGPDQLHICMCYSPIRYAWDLQHQYLNESGWGRGLKSWLAKWVLHKIRMWDLRTANGVDEFIAISSFVARRIAKIYRRDATVIHPPVDVETFKLCENKEDFYLTASRMVPYKRIDLIVEAFTSMPAKKLVVIGNGPDFAKIRAKAGPNVTFLGYQPLEILRDYMQRAKAFVFAAKEDFGIVPLEAQACGTPVIAFGEGGTAETIRGIADDQGVSSSTGVFFKDQTIQAIVEAVARFESYQPGFPPTICRNNALRFSPERFRNEFSKLVEKTWATFAKSLRTGEKSASPP